MNPCHPTHLLHHVARLIIRHAPHAIIPAAIVCGASPTADLRVRLPVPPMPIETTFTPGDLWVFPPVYDDVPVGRRVVDVGVPQPVPEPSTVWVLVPGLVGLVALKRGVRC